MIRLLTTILAGVVAAFPVFAQDAPELITDRPDQTESSVVVPKGSFQLEIGALFSRDDEDGVRTETFEAPGTLLRIGLHKRVELRLGWAGYLAQDLEFGNGGGADIDGKADGEVGAKIYIFSEKGARPEFAILFHTSVPIGHDDLTSDHYDPDFRLSFSHTLSDRLSLGYNLGLAWETGVNRAGEESTLSDALYTVALGIGINDTVGAFVELYGDVAASAEGKPAHAFDGGFTFLLRPNLQLDLAGGLGLSDEADDWLVGLGLSVRWPE